MDWAAVGQLSSHRYNATRPRESETEMFVALTGENEEDSMENRIFIGRGDCVTEEDCVSNCFGERVGAPLGVSDVESLDVGERESICECDDVAVGDCVCEADSACVSDCVADWVIEELLRCEGVPEPVEVLVIDDVLAAVEVGVIVTDKERVGLSC